MTDSEHSGQSGDSGCIAAHLFDVVWETLVDVLGTAATATLLRRSVKRAVTTSGELEGLVITRDGFDYAYHCPERWRSNNAEGMVALRQLARELTPLLIELTGPVVIRRFSAISQLRRCEILFEEQNA